MSERLLNDQWHTAIFWHGVAMLPRLRAMAREERMRVMKEAEEHSQRLPLWLEPFGKESFTVPSWSSKPITAAAVMALLAFGIWVQVGEREEEAPDLVRDWPELKVASRLCDLGAGRTGDAVCT